RPLWIAPPDPPIPILVPIPPMTMLTKLNIATQYWCDYESYLYRLPSSRDPKATLTFICWILDSNPHLLDVVLDDLTIKDQRDVRLLTKSISGLKNLQRLALKTRQGMTWKTPPDLILAYFFCCPPSLRSVKINLMYDKSHWSDSTQAQLPLWEKDEVECGVPATIPRRQEPLAHLEILEVFNNRYHGVFESDIRSMLAHCPNLTDLGVSTLSGIRNAQDLAQDIAQLSPKLSRIQDLAEYGFETADLF
ncbi:hypothetical protein BGZ95_008218, partial [Linnemannia exigua]